jgi:hypothetical protein
LAAGRANEMEIEDGTIWVYGVGEDGVMAFTDFGIKNLIETRFACGLRRMNTEKFAFSDAKRFLQQNPPRAVIVT